MTKFNHHRFKHSYANTNIHAYTHANMHINNTYTLSDVQPTTQTQPILHRNSDSDGIIQYIIDRSLYKKPGTYEKLTKLKKYLVSLISIVTHYINTHHPSDTLSSHQPGLKNWLDATQQLPLITCSAIQKKEISHQVKGITIAKGVLALIMETILNVQNEGLDAFLLFLQEQEQAIQLRLKKNLNQFSTTLIFCVIEAHNIMQNSVFYPKICFYHLLFNRKNAQLILNCNSSDSFEINFEYTSFSAFFNDDALKDELISHQFEQFIQRHLLSSIQKSDNFFDRHLTQSQHPPTYGSE